MLPPHMPKPVKKRQSAAVKPARGFEVPAVPRPRVVGAPRDGRLIIGEPLPSQDIPEEAA